MNNLPARRRHPMRPITASRGVVVRDFAIFQVKLFLDGLKDVTLSAISLGALVIDMISGGGRKPRIFYSVLSLSERFDLWLNLSGAISRLESEDLGDDGLFAASDAGSDNLLGKIEELVRGGDLSKEFKDNLKKERERLDAELRRRQGRPPRDPGA